MGKFNLLNKPWIQVIDNNNVLSLVSIKQIFQNAHNYKGIYGDNSIQNFSILRILLAILQTVFERYQINGQKQMDDNSLKQTWQELWGNQSFSNSLNVINHYLDSQEDKFNLYDDKKPFFQVTNENLKQHGVKKTGKIKPKLINRLISESSNKIDMFSPTSEKYVNKLSNDELARWLITFQAYTGTSDKKKFPGMKSSASKGWLLGLGSIYLKGDNLFHTILLNLILNHLHVQTPIWEKSTDEKMNLDKINYPENLAELYTNTSRLLTIDPNTDLSKQDIAINAIQLPKIDSTKGYLLEPMSLWQVPRKGKYKGKVIPKPHQKNQSLWRSFGLLVYKKQHPKIMDWLKSSTVQEVLSSNKRMLKIVAVGASYNKDASSMLNDEINDSIYINPEIVNDSTNIIWINIIDDEVNKTKDAILILKDFAKDLMDIRNDNNSDLANKVEQQAYFDVDLPFKHWISKITPNNDPDVYSYKWRKILRKILLEEADSLTYPLNRRDLLGISNNDSTKNIMTARILFFSRLNKALNLKGVDND